MIEKPKRKPGNPNCIKGNPSNNPLGRPKREVQKLNIRAVLDNLEILHNDGSITKGFDPFINLAILGATAKSEKVRCDACAELCRYLAPQLKSVEVKGDDIKPVMIKFDFGNRQPTFEYNNVIENGIHDELHSD